MPAPVKKTMSRRFRSCSTNSSSFISVAPDQKETLLCRFTIL
jgi:hypothetical protein